VLHNGNDQVVNLYKTAVVVFPLTQSKAIKRIFFDAIQNALEQTHKTACEECSKKVLLQWIERSDTWHKVVSITNASRK
jgi:hypothetical protein